MISKGKAMGSMHARIRRIRPFAAPRSAASPPSRRAPSPPQGPQKEPERRRPKEEGRGRTVRWPDTQDRRRDTCLRLRVVKGWRRSEDLVVLRLMRGRRQASRDCDGRMRTEQARLSGDGLENGGRAEKEMGLGAWVVAPRGSASGAIFGASRGVASRGGEHPDAGPMSGGNAHLPEMAQRSLPARPSARPGKKMGGRGKGECRECSGCEQLQKKNRGGAKKERVGESKRRRGKRYVLVVGR